MAYSKEFREAMVARLLSPGGGLKTLARESGLNRSTLRRWKVEFSEGGGALESKSKKPQDWSAEEKFLAVQETGPMNEEDLGAYCRRNGLHVGQLNMWKAQCLASIRKGPKTDPEKRELRQEVKVLKRELRRKEKALAETAALLVLKKKMATIWGREEDEDDY